MISTTFLNMQNPNMGPNTGWKPHETKEENLKVLKYFIKSDNIWALEYKKNCKVIGSISVHEDNKRKGVNAKMIGYMLSQDYRGQGLIPEAVNKVLEFLFYEIKVNSVSCILLINDLKGF